MLGRGMNLGNTLDAAAGLHLEERYFDVLKDTGLDTVRLPVKWSLHADEVRVDRAVGVALDREMNVILNVHHYDELQADPVQP
jgi:endoglucanase